jgi:glycosyltransferase involved in cell wall biosynthesis
MTSSAETSSSQDHARGLLGARWRDRAERTQDAAIPPGRVVLSCSAVPGAGGLGRHFDEIAAAAARREQPAVCISAASLERARRSTLRAPSRARLLSRLPLELARGWGTRAFFEEFDGDVARRLPQAEHLIAFNGQALRQLRAARRGGYESVSLVSANSHLRRVVRLHAEARRQYPFERSWAEQLVERNVAEYELADRILVSSRYIRDSFLEEGVPEEKLTPFPVTPDPRFTPAGAPRSDTFDVVYVGSLTVAKGVPLLVDAVRRLSHGDLRLRLIGGWSTPGMRRFLQSACAEDRRIEVRPGDPLPALRDARLCVHATFEDGFAYAPAEALASGVPVIVSEDTGMKELIERGGGGVIVPTGDLDALTGAIDAAYRGEGPSPVALRGADD